MSIDEGAQVTSILFACGPCVVILNCLGHVLYLGRAPRTKETPPDFREWCRVTRHPQVFCELTGCQRTPRFWGVTTSRDLEVMTWEKFHGLFMSKYFSATARRAKA